MTDAMDQLQSSVLLSLNPTADPALRSEAFAFCQRLRQSPHGFAFVLQALSPSMRPEVSFWCLQLIHETVSDPSRYPHTLPDISSSTVRTTLYNFLLQLSYPQLLVNTTNQQTPQFPSFLLNKLAQLISALVAADYPHAWPDAFRQTILPLATASPTSGPTSASPPSVAPNSVTYASVSMFFRLLRSIDDDVTSIRAAQQTDWHRLTSIRVKDAMRDDCIFDIFSMVVTFIQEPRVARQAYDIVARYAEWVDLSLLLSNQILSPMYNAITASSPCDCRAAAAAALRAIILKRMDLRSKSALLKTLQLEKLLATIRADTIIACDDGSVDSELNLQGGQVEVAALVNTIALTCLDIIKYACKSKKQSTSKNDVSIEPELFAHVATVARNSLPVALQFLNENADDGTGSQTLDCVASFVNVYGQMMQNDDGHTSIALFSKEGLSIINAIVNVIEERSRYVPEQDFFDSNSERGRVFLELRKLLLKKVFSNIARLFTSVCVNYIKVLFDAAVVREDAARIEVALAMLIALTAVAGDSPEVAAICRAVIMSPPKCMNYASDPKVTVEMAKLFQLVSNCYFEIVGRCPKVFVYDDGGPLLETVLSTIFDGRGLGNGCSETVRLNAANALVRIAKPLRGVMAPAHVEAVVRASHQHILPLEDDMHGERWESQMTMLEATGYLLGIEQKHHGTVNVVGAMLKPLLDGIEAKTGMARVSYITAVCVFSKGFGGDYNVAKLNGATNNDGVKTKEKNGTVLIGDGSNDIVTTKGQGLKMSEEMRAVWVVCLETVIKAGWCSLKPGEDLWMPETRLKLLLFLHRMVETVGATVIPYLGRTVPELLTWGKSASEVKETLSVMSQSVIEFGKRCEEAAKQFHFKAVSRMREISFSVDRTTMLALSEADRESVDIVRAFIYWVSSLVSNELTNVLWCADEKDFGVVMNWIIEYAVGEKMDARIGAPVMRMCWQTLGQIIVQFGGTGQVRGLDEFAVKQISKAVVLCGVRGVVFRNGDYNSGQATGVASEVVKTIQICMKQYGSLFSEEMYHSAAHAVNRNDWDVLIREIANSNDVNICVQRWVWLVRSAGTGAG